MMRLTRVPRGKTGPRLDDERGLALAVAVFALVVIGAMVAGTFFAGRLEQQSGQNTFFLSQAAEAAEAGLSDAMASTPATTLEALPIGGAPLELGTIPLGSRVAASREVSRLTNTVFLIRAVGSRQDADGTPLAARAVGSLVHLVKDPLGGPAMVAPLAERGWVQLY